MAYVPRGMIKGKKGKEVIAHADIDHADIAAIDFAGLEASAGATETVLNATKDVTIQLPGHAATDLFTVEDDASHARLQVDGAGKVSVGGKLVIPTGSGADILIATLTTAFGDPATLDDGFVAIYKETTSNPDKMYLVTVMAGAFYLEELTAAAAA